MNVKKINKVFSGKPGTMPVCPVCKGQKLGVTASIMVCGSCDWYEGIDLTSPHHTPLTRYKVATAMRSHGGDKDIHYFLPDGLDKEDRSLAERRLLERCSRVTAVMDSREAIVSLLKKMADNSDFNAAYLSDGEFPEDLWIGIHGRTGDVSGLGAFAQDPRAGLFFRINSFIYDVDPEIGDISYEQKVNNVAAGSSWEILAKKQALWSSFIRMEKVTPDTPMWGDLCNAEVDSLVSVYRFTVCRYGFYPIHFVMYLQGWCPGTDGVSVLEDSQLEKDCVSNISIGESDILGDDVLMQPILWSAFNISGGGRVQEDWAPRYMSTLYSSRYLITCAVSEEQNRGSFAGRASVRDMSNPTGVVSLKKVPGETVEECISNIQRRNRDIERIEKGKGEVVSTEKTWDILDTDPLASLMEIKNMTCWMSDVGHVAMAKRKSTIFK